MIVDQRVDVVVADRTLVHAGGVIGWCAAVSAPATTVWNTAELLHVHVYQLAGSAPLISVCRETSRANQFARQWVAIRQMRDLMTRQDRSDRARRDAQFGADCVRSTTLLPSRLQHLGFNLGSCSRG